MSKIVQSFLGCKGIPMGIGAVIKNKLTRRALTLGFIFYDCSFNTL
ncbi:hypothetical protein [Clostridium estertheticum]|nr:hypothetical protein [Clostridium estertheticum]MBU3158077.1 hypothetical protein [Clostridium estertheticum]